MLYTDPSGMDIWTINSSGQITRKEKDDNHYLYFEDQYGNRTNQFIQLSSEEILASIQEKKKDDKSKDGRKVSMATSNKTDDVFKFFKFVADHSDVEWVVHKNEDTYTIGTVYDPITSGSYDTYGLSKPDASIHSHPGTSFSHELSSMGYGSNFAISDLKSVKWGQSPEYNYVYFPLSSNIYQVKMPKPIFIRKATNNRSFYWGVLNNR